MFSLRCCVSDCGIHVILQVAVKELRAVHTSSDRVATLDRRVLTLTAGSDERVRRVCRRRRQQMLIYLSLSDPIHLLGESCGRNPWTHCLGLADLGRETIR